MSPKRLAPDPPGLRVQRVLARFEVGCPALREFQVNVLIDGRRPQLVVLPAVGKPRGHVELVLTRNGGVRTCSFPAGATPGQRRAIEDLAWGLHDALSQAAGPVPEAAEAQNPP